MNSFGNPIIELSLGTKSEFSLQYSLSSLNIVEDLDGVIENFSLVLYVSVRRCSWENMEQLLEL